MFRHHAIAYTNDNILPTNYLQINATKILQVMALNGLEANPSKTEFILLNNKQKEQSEKIKVRTAEVQETRSIKLLGITMDNDQNGTVISGGRKD